MFRLLTCLIFLGLTLTGCSLLGFGASGDADPSRALSPRSRETLQAELTDNVSPQFRRSIRVTADKVADNLADSERRNAIRKWETDMLAQADEIGRMEDPLRQLTAYWVFTGIMQKMLEEKVKEENRAKPPRALRQVSEQLEALENIARQWLDEKEFDELEKQVEKVLSENTETLPGQEEGWGRYLANAPGRMFKSVASVPLKPIRAVTSGAGGVLGIPQLVEVLDAYPEEWRTQAEILLTHDTITTATQSFERISHASDRLTSAVATLPRDLEGTIRATEQPFREMQQAMRETTAASADIRSTVQELQQIDTTVTNAAAGLNRELRPTVLDIDTMLKQLDATLVTFGNVMTLLGAGPETPEEEAADAAEDAREEAEGGDDDFRILDYAKTANEVETMLVQLEKTLLTLGDVVAGGEMIGRSLEQVNESLKQTTQEVQGSANDIIDHLFWRLVILAVIVFVLALVYRLIVMGLKRREGRREAA